MDSQQQPTVHTDSVEKDGEQKEENGVNIKETDSHDEKENLEEEDKQRVQALTAELEKIESELRTLRDVINSKQKRANEIKALLGNPIVNDVKEKFRSLQDSEAIQKTNQAFKSAGEKTSAAFSNIGRRFGDVRAKIGETLGSSISNVKAKMNTGSRSEGILAPRGQSSAGKVSALPTSSIDEEVHPGY